MHRGPQRLPRSPPYAQCALHNSESPVEHARLSDTPDRLDATPVGRPGAARPRDGGSDGVPGESVSPGRRAPNRHLTTRKEVSRPPLAPIRCPLPITTRSKPKGWFTLDMFGKKSASMIRFVQRALASCGPGDWQHEASGELGTRNRPAGQGNAPNLPDSPGGPDGSWPPGPIDDCPELCRGSDPCDRSLLRTAGEYDRAPGWTQSLGPSWAVGPAATSHRGRPVFWDGPGGVRRTTAAARRCL